VTMGEADGKCRSSRHGSGQRGEALSFAGVQR
jgi:hypothetical protein